MNNQSGQYQNHVPSSNNTKGGKSNTNNNGKGHGSTNYNTTGEFVALENHSNYNYNHSGYNNNSSSKKMKNAEHYKNANAIQKKNYR